MNSKTETSKTNKEKALKPIIKIDLPKAAPDDATLEQIAQQKTIMLCATYKTARRLRAVAIAALRLPMDKDNAAELRELKTEIEHFTGSTDDGTPGDREHARWHEHDQKFYCMSVDLAFDLLDEARSMWAAMLSDRLMGELCALLSDLLKAHKRDTQRARLPLAQIMETNRRLDGRPLAEVVTVDEPLDEQEQTDEDARPTKTAKRSKTEVVIVDKKIHVIERKASKTSTEARPTASAAHAGNIIDGLQREIVERASKPTKTAKQSADDRKRAKLQGKSANKASATNG